MPHNAPHIESVDTPPPRARGRRPGRPIPAHKIKVRVGGMPRWNQVLVELLRSVGIDAFITRDLYHLPAPQRWLRTCKEFAGLKIEHVLFPGPPQRMERFGRFIGVRVVYHFIGSDVLALANMPPADRDRRIGQLKRYGSAFVADGPDLQAELASLGIEADILRCIPLNVLGEVTHLPPQFTVLSYWGARPDFYRADVVLAAAARLSDVPFLIVGTDGAGMSATPNVRFLGDVKDMDRVYRQASALLRLPLHDGLPKMVLEAQARGRRVIASRVLPHAWQADDLATTLAAIEEVRGLCEPDLQAARYVRGEYDPAAEAQRALELYRSLLG